MTKKDYELIADALNASHFVAANDQRTIADVANRLAHRLAEQNPRFNITRFMSAAIPQELRDLRAAKLYGPYIAKK